MQKTFQEVKTASTKVLRQELICILEKNMPVVRTGHEGQGMAGGEDVKVGKGQDNAASFVRISNFILRVKGSHWKILS